MGKVVRVDASRWKNHKGKDACSEKGPPSPADAAGRASSCSPEKHGLLAAQLLPDGRLQLLVEGYFLTDPVAAMAAAIQLADYARSLHERTEK
ncbi:hypothetical protein [Cupriavidus sp. D384]|uniref:hypothetical protein n=1 Tax=Cupriavidus sp. D384 TaxID=1538095 RepID=UPI0012E77A19|nr:hypothetical protein [Cupriavidus sp. D384]